MHILRFVKLEQRNVFALLYLIISYAVLGLLVDDVDGLASKFFQLNSHWSKHSDPISAL